ncbi:acyl-CoA N-acyltransferase [Penicillium angulare]|uniref:acyl-CoA N-acyltransferase n=1 Tax=Penicillium angulare TaxID=116970 RepID=UPI0025421F76|nr:acyl-CoA N-acyltransferase [Penicillium angulare]KAJ5288825.1 acyl-CoA N-acyltransferase [Penicillium angulare]
MKTVQLPGFPDQKTFVRLLTVSDLKECIEVESAFPPQERCSQEKFIYRLTVCPKLCLGLFVEKSNGPKLIGHVIATRIPGNRVTDGSMEMPDRWTGSWECVKLSGEVIGNDPEGRFLGVHSLAVRSDCQGNGVGRALMNEYISYVGGSVESKESIVIIAHDHLIRFYESFGFKNLGPSPCAFGGGGWFDMELVV